MSSLNSKEYDNIKVCYNKDKHISNHLQIAHQYKHYVTGAFYRFESIKIIPRLPDNFIDDYYYALYLDDMLRHYVKTKSIQITDKVFINVIDEIIKA